MANGFSRLGRFCLLLCAALLFCLSGIGAAAEKGEAALAETARPAGNPGEKETVSAQKRATLKLDWQELEPGLELGMNSFAGYSPLENAPVFVVLRVDPKRHDFVLSMASQSGQAYSLAGWSDRDNLKAGINASMYLPDNITSTGYMRSGAFINNKGIGERLGAFFVAGGRKPGLPAADMIERDMPNWRERLDEYDIVVQNFRFLSSEGELLWRDEGRMYSIAVVGKDKAGRILFMLCQRPMTPASFVKCLEGFSLELDSVMYVEGGAQAGMFVRLASAQSKDAKGSAAVLPGASSHAASGGTEIIYVWKGRQSLFNTRGNPDALLPNVIGVRGK